MDAAAAEAGMIVDAAPSLADTVDALFRRLVGGDGDGDGDGDAGLDDAMDSYNDDDDDAGNNDACGRVVAAAAAENPS